MDNEKLLMSMFLTFLIFLGSSHRMIVDMICDKNLKEIKSIICMALLSLIIGILISL